MDNDRIKKLQDSESLVHRELLVERFRNPLHVVTKAEQIKAADTIQQQAERIRELQSRLEIDQRHSIDGIEARDTTIRLQDDKIAELEQQVAAKQAEIDWLMLEFCPNEVTSEQMENWAASQKKAFVSKPK